MKYGAQYLLRACDNGAEDMEAREGMCLCSLLGGMSLANAKLGAWGLVPGCHVPYPVMGSSLR